MTFDVGADIVIHAVGAGVVIVVAFLVAGYIRTSRQAMHDLIDIFSETVNASKGLAAQDRAEMHRMMTAVLAGAATGLRIEHAAEGVADDLRDAHQRADDAAGLSSAGEAHGAAADAFGRSAPA